MEQSYSSPGGTAYPRFRNVALPAAALVGVNIVLMYLVAATPLSIVNDLLFSVPILGLIVYGAALTGGNILAERGLQSGSMGMAALGTTLLQVAYGLFGGGILGRAPIDSRGLLLAVTLLVTVTMTIAIAAYVYLRNADFDHWNTWSFGAFIIGAALVLVGSFVPVVLAGGFLFIFLGFALRLGYEIWHVKANYDPNSSLVHALGIYVAFTGVFVHVLQIALRMFADR
jgi:hypothetical protein